MKIYLIRLLAPYPKLYEKMLSFYRFLRKKRVLFKSNFFMTTALAFVYFTILLPAKIWNFFFLEKIFSFSRAAGWQDCSIITNDITSYINQYGAANKLPPLYVRIIRKKIRFFRCLSAFDVTDDSKPPSDVYALF